ncbi:hypothetical protein PM082_003778 [Marasmius tenuissimus]|nr:hypothetical protein PM082_003778 [Marasmius tenuissimus]
MGWLDLIPKIGDGGLAYLPGQHPKEPQSEIFTRPLKPLLEKLGLGAAPNTVPSDSPRTDCEPRVVKICYHPVMGAIGGFVDHLISPGKGGLYNLDHQEAPPNPRYHWAVLVGDFYHELNGDHNLNVVYQNGKLNDQKWEWEFYTVGSTRYNDEAIRIAGHEAIKKMPPVYNIYDNNCQCFVLKLLDIICEHGRRKAATSWSWGVQMGVLSLPQEKEIEAPGKDEGVSGAQAFMNDKTPRLEKHDVGLLAVKDDALVLVHRA